MGEENPYGATEDMVKCDITGDWVHKDDIIELHGKRVGAAGKEILLERLKSGELLPGEMERPTVVRRFVCILLDGILLGLINAGITLAVSDVSFTPTAADLEKTMATQGLASLLGALVSLTYLTLLHGIKGQTLGKMAGKIKVVKADGTPIGMGVAAWRALAYMGPSAVVGAVMMAGLSLETFQIVNIVVVVYALANVIFALVDRSTQKALHDRLAGTRVISVE